MNQPHAVFLVGAPAVGKTAVASVLIGPMAERTFLEKPKVTFNRHRDLCAAGHYRGETFDGADTVPYNAAAPWLEFWASLFEMPALTLFDGDRFSNGKALNVVRQEVVALCVLLEAPPEVLDDRRRQRGSNQNVAWMRGRETKARRFFATFPEARALRLDAAKAAPPVLAESVRIWLDGQA